MTGLAPMTLVGVGDIVASWDSRLRRSVEGLALSALVGVDDVVASRESLRSSESGLRPSWDFSSATSAALAVSTSSVAHAV